MKPLLPLPLCRLVGLLIALAGAWLPRAGQAQATTNLPPHWQWQNPLPQGFNLVDLHVFNDSTALAVGNAGTVVKTSDYGRTWRVNTAGTRADLLAVSFATDRIGWVGHYNQPAVVRKTVDGGLTWSVQSLGVPQGASIEDIQFLTPLEGYVLYYVGISRSTQLRRTTNGGQTWTLQNNFIPAEPNRIQFLSSTVGYAASGRFRGTIQKTTDGGQTWRNIAPTADQDYGDMSFVDADQGWICRYTSTGNAIYRTSDGGQTWQPQQLPYPTEVSHISFADTFHGVAQSFYSFWYTSDGGTNWQQADDSKIENRNKIIMQVRPSGAAWLLGGGGRWFRSDTFGRVWQEADSLPAGWNRQAQFPDPTHGWVIKSRTRLASTADRGASWQTIDLSTRTPSGTINWGQSRMEEMHFVDRDTGFVAGWDNDPVLGGQRIFALETRNGGQSWTQRLHVVLPTASLGFLPFIRALRFQSARRGLLLAGPGFARRTTDGGQTWTTPAMPAAVRRRYLSAIAWPDAQTVYVVGDSLTLLKSTDGGASFQALAGLSSLLPASTNLPSVCFTSPQVGLIAVGSQIVRTVDGGQTWVDTTLPADQSVVRNAFYRLSFSTKLEGWAIGSDNIVSTADGGQTWTRVAIFAPYNIGIGYGTRIDRYNGWGFGYDQNLLHYSEKFVQAQPLARTAYYTGEALALAFRTEGSFPASEQRFAVQLSNARGRFRRGQVRVVGQGTTSPLAVTLPADVPPGSRYRLRVVQADSLVLGGDNGQDLLIRPLVPPDLVVSTPLTLAGGTYHNVTITSTGSLNLLEELVVNGALLVQPGGVLATGTTGGCAAITGPGSFTLAAGATLRICDAAGISATGAVGAMQLAGARSFSPEATYVYTGGPAQVTGPGLPGQVRHLTVDNAGAGLTLSQGVAIGQVLRLSAGDLHTGGHPLLLPSTPAGTALIDNTGGVVLGTGTMQRYLDRQNPAGRGYRHYSAPVRNTTLADLAAPGYAPELNLAYNTSPTPALVTPFPTLFSYDQRRLATSPATGGSEFDKGWLVPAALTTAMGIGQGFTAHVANGVLVDFTGTFTTGTVSRANLGRGPQADAGWHLLGNPYPSPLDWSRVLPAERPGIDGSAYVFQSTGPYRGTYRAYVNGLGDPLVAAGSGFFVRTSSPGVNGSVRLTNAHRVTEFGPQPAFGRPLNDLRPQLELRVHGAGHTDALTVYLQAGATTGVDAEYDATKLANPTGLNLAALAGPTAQAQAIAGLPLLGAAEVVVPLALDVPAAGRYRFEVAALAHFGAATVYLHDALSGTHHVLVAGQTYAFTLARAGSGHGRFRLGLRPAGVLAGTGALAADAVQVYPNPARGHFTLRLPPVAGVAAVQATLHNALGQEVRRLRVPLTAAGGQALVDGRGLPPGVYLLRVQVGHQVVRHRLVLE